MLSTNEWMQDLVLVGGGHAHALVLRKLAMRPIAGLRITLISPASHTPYSGMLPGLLAGHYGFEETHIDLERLCAWAQVRFICAEVTGLDPVARQLTLAGRPGLRYDLLSLDVGSQPEIDSVLGAREFAVPVKPVAGLWQRWQNLESRLVPGQRLAVVGGGAGGVELILAMAHRLRDRELAFDLYCGGPTILQDYNRRARAVVENALARHRVTLHCGARVERVSAGELQLFGAGSTPFDALFWCTGASAAPWLAASGLATDERGFLAIRDTLQAVDDDRIFAAGDCATQVNHPRPKAGVYAVRQGPVLAANLRRLLLGQELREHRPQRRFLSLLSLGDRQAAADRGPFSASGAWVWRWKDRIDREFMQRFSELPSMGKVRAVDRLPELPTEPQPHCGGCGAKVGADMLHRVLQRLAGKFPEHARGQSPGEDAVRSAPGSELICQSIDALRGLVADPWLMGRIAANHALSDLYASGARPHSALALVTLPFAAPALLERDLEQVLAGALESLREADCPLLGGHSMQGIELQLGFAVTGVPVAEGLAKRGLQADDSLILTRPLGSGAVFAAHMQLRADGRDVRAAIDSLLQSNAAAARLALEHGASAATDVTGFGLAGHLLEMLDPEQGAELELASIPCLPGAREALAAGIRSTMHEANRRSVVDRVQATVDESGEALLFDPQTGGGLLIGISPDSAPALLAALRESGYPAAIIGRVTDAGRVSLQPGSGG